jgi:putative transcriptional regulator
MRHIIRILCALLLLLAAHAHAQKEMTAILLVASPEMQDPRFAGSVVLVMNHIAPAPAGLILNRPTPVSVSQVVPGAYHDAKAYFGGPVDVTRAVSFLFRADAPPRNSTPVIGNVYLSSDRALLRELLAREKPMAGLRVFLGYAGWAPGQLEAEIARGDWSLEPADADAIFNSGNEVPWPGGSAPDPAKPGVRSQWRAPPRP